MFSELSVNESEFLSKTLKEDLRLDGRNKMEHRDISVKYGNSTNGLVVLSLGKTQVIAASSKKITTPQKGKANEGSYRFNIDFRHLVHEADFTGGYENLQQSRVEIVRLLEKVFVTSRAIDTNSLCISKGKIAWTVSIEAAVLNYDGNLLDAVFLAVLLWLKTLKIPQVRYKDNKITILDEKQWKNINVHHMPIPITFWFTDDEGDVPIIDPNLKEEKISTSRNTVFMNVFGDVCGVTTVGSLWISPDTYLNCLTTAEEKAKHITKILRESLKNKENLVLSQEFEQKMTLTHEDIKESHIITDTTKHTLQNDSSKPKSKLKKGKKGSKKGAKELDSKMDSDDEEIVQNLESEFK